MIQKIILIVVFYMIIVALFNNTIIKKMKNEKEKNTGIMRMLQADHLVKLQNIGNMPDAQDEYAELQRKIDEYTRYFINEDEKKYFVEKITEYAKMNKILSKNISYDKDKGENPEFVINADLETDYKHLLRYMEDLNNMEKRIKIESIKMEKNDQILDVEIEFAAFMLENTKSNGVVADE